MKYKDNPKEYMRLYYQKNKKHIKELTKKYYEDNKELWIQYNSTLSKKEYMRVYMNSYRNSKKNKQYRKSYYQLHKDEISKNNYKNYKRKLFKDTNYKIRCYLTTRIYKALKGYHKSKSTIKLLGCSIEFFKEHLSKQFKKGMSWYNYGKWHIDHIIPCCKFNLSKPSEQLKCFHYTNLQPLWAEENLSKSGK